MPQGTIEAKCINALALCHPASFSVSFGNCEIMDKIGYVQKSAMQKNTFSK